jgi:hypothetical protein
MTFIKANLNPTGKATSDCVVRAIMKATKKTWLDVYKNLCAIGGLEFKMPSDKKVYEIYLDQLGWKKQKMPKIFIPELRMVNGQRQDGMTYRRYTVQKFAEHKPKGIFIISVANHLTTIVDGNLYDTWDCSQKSVGNYWSY